MSTTRTDFFYAQMPDRTAGIRVNRLGHTCTVGSTVNMTGRVRTNASGERYLDADSVAKIGSAAVRPVAVNGCSIRGCGLCCTGLLVRAWGAVTSADPAAGSCDLRCGNSIVKVACPAGSVPPVGSYVTVTGACSCERQGAATIPLILTRSSNDLLRLN